jgi:hypothetical protein
MTKLEIYGIALLVLVLALGGSYFKGRHDEFRATATEQLAANAKALEAAATAQAARADADDKARRKANDFIDQIDQGIASVKAKFAQLPSVVVDAHGCPQLTDAARLRWDAIELLPAGPTADAAGNPSAALPAGQVPAP